MENYILAALGIIVSIVTFLIGYRQTIGAKKERILAANSELEKILIRRMVMENYHLNLVDIKRLADGKARDFKIKTSDLIPDSQLLNNIYTRVVETDFLSQRQRNEILKRIVPAIQENEKKLLQERSDLYQFIDRNADFSTNQFPLTAVMAIAATIVGSISTLLPYLNKIKDNYSDIIPLALTTAIASLGAIVSIIVFRKFKDSQFEVSLTGNSSMLERAISLERDVARILMKKFQFVKTAGPNDRGFDFIVESESGKMLVEVKNWTRDLPYSIIFQAVHKLTDCVKKEKASLGFLVTRENLPTGRIDFNTADTKVMAFDEFRKYISKI